MCTHVTRPFLPPPSTTHSPKDLRVSEPRFVSFLLFRSSLLAFKKCDDSSQQGQVFISSILSTHPTGFIFHQITFIVTACSKPLKLLNSPPP
jgi:hypothetical protein